MTKPEETVAPRLARGRACRAPATPRALESRGVLWLIASFVLCPCHLPLTLAWAGILLAGTTAGGLLRSHPVAAGVLVTLVWAAGTWRGLRLLRAARKFAGTHAPRAAVQRITVPVQHDERN
jgi:hypothetical protein